MIEIKAFAIERTAMYFDGLSDVATVSMRMAINTVADRGGLKLLRDAIEMEIAFPKGYLNRDRLELRKKATTKDLQAVIAARERPTSLARFVPAGTPTTGNRRGGLTAIVTPGSPARMPGAFLMRLKAGTTLTADNFNIGLAIRLKPGHRLKSKKQVVQLKSNLQMVYGPSVAQVFRTVAEDQTPEIISLVETEFYRNFVRLSGEQK